MAVVRSSSSSGRRRRKALQPPVAFSQEQASAQRGRNPKTGSGPRDPSFEGPDNGKKDADSELREGAGGRRALLRDGVPRQGPRHHLLLLQVHRIVQQRNNQPRFKVKSFTSSRLIFYPVSGFNFCRHSPTMTGSIIHSVNI